MEKRTVERIPVNVEIKFHCCDKVYYGTITNLSEKGMFISTMETCFPFDFQFEILISLKEKILHVPVNITRIILSPDSYDGLGIEIPNPSQDFLIFVDNHRLVCKF